ERAKPYGRFSPLPKHPALYRDIALLVDEEVPAAEVYGLVARCGLPYIERVEIFDCYTGPPIPKGKKNLALRLFLRAPERTLTDEEADEVQRELINRLQEAGMTLR
ncbi:MAG: phenylalanine--tRNA ligase subunit beta, partial [Deltaproteobacteria bacterium]